MLRLEHEGDPAYIAKQRACHEFATGWLGGTKMIADGVDLTEPMQYALIQLLVRQLAKMDELRAAQGRAGA